MLGALLVLVAVLAQCALAHTVDLHPNSEHCFFEDMHSGDEMTLTYQVSGGGHLDIDTWIKNPDGQTLFEQIRKDTGSYEFIADKDGRYTSFNVHGVLYLTEDEGLIPAERELRDLANNIQMFKDEQQYLVMRERIHRNTQIRA
ncbi:Emp24p [Malassezia vespertilionis]|uniref:Emp24p n=1 Tax=Malassezia vespertilionis TaxID=2020962 RepID=A0A2N1JF16_9BASI|nr:Emp24p [Malassezia vespertilionis]